MIGVFELLIVLIALIIGTYTDFKSREVPDYLNFLLIAFGFGMGLIKSIVESSFTPLILCFIGFGIAFIISLIMFYAGQWGGGDAKMLMGIGAVLGVTYSYSDFFVSFIVNTMICGAFYGLLWGLMLGIINRQKVYLEIKKIVSKPYIRKLRIILLITTAISVIMIFVLPLNNFKIPLIIMTFLMFSIFYIWLFVKAIESVCMIKKVKPSELTEGDWIVEEVKIGKSIIASKKDLGVSKEQITKLISLWKKKKISFVTIKTGIPFIPSFLLSFIITYIYGNLFLLFFKILQ